jgi:hypothetical protein
MTEDQVLLSQKMPRSPHGKRYRPNASEATKSRK